MPIIDARTGAVRKEYSLAKLQEAAVLMRGYNLAALCAAGSGHAGGTLSIMDITAALYLHEARHDPKDPSWEDRDRIIWSTGHKAPALYVGLGMAGYFDIADVVRLRKLYSPYQGHPHWTKLEGVEVSSGSLGQGLSVGVGMALGARLDHRPSRVYVINGDGEQQEGQIWEAAMEAAQFKLDNLVSIIDRNRLQIDGWVKAVMNVESLNEKYAAFGWHVIEIDGHDMAQILDAFAKARTLKEKPTVIIANTVKGKGVSFMENVAGWHGRAPNRPETEKALAELGLEQKLDLPKLLKTAEAYQAQVTPKLMAKVPKFSRDYFWNKLEEMKVKMEPTRFGFGKALSDKGGDERIVCLGADISGSICISQFFDKHPERKDRWFSVGIAEQSGTALAAGLAKEGRIPVFGTYGVFAAGRNLDQLRTTVCYGNFNVLIVGAHGGVSVGPDGATHQALEDLFQICGLPNMHCSVPCDSVETYRATNHLLFDIHGPKYIRFAREATPIVTTEHTPYVFGLANVIRFRREQPEFIKAFDTRLADEYQDEHEHLTIIACGPMVPEAMRAAWILKKDCGLDTRVINMHTLKPLDKDTIVRAAKETGIIVTAEEHQVGGLGNLVSAVLAQAPELYGRKVIAGMVGVKDRFGESGFPWELLWEFEVSGEHIAKMAKDLYDFKRAREK